MDLQIGGIFKLINYSNLGINRLGTKVAIIIDPRK